MSGPNSLSQIEERAQRKTGVDAAGHQVLPLAL